MVALAPVLHLVNPNNHGEKMINAMPSDQQRETAQYVADMILELRNMSKALKLYTIIVPLEYAYYEAFSVANKVLAPSAEIDRLNDLSRQAEAENGS